MNTKIIEIYTSLYQQGPGSDKETKAALACVNNFLPAAPAVADFGCGTGRSTLVLAEALRDGYVTAVDNVQEFCAALRQTVASKGLGERVRVVESDMREISIDDGSLDLVWSEGAAYAIGFGEALWRWSAFLKTGGFCVVSECEWIRDDAPEEVRKYWADKYEGMRSAGRNKEKIRDLGLEIIDRRVLPEECWSAYYGQLLALLQADSSKEVVEYKEGVLEEQRIRERYGQYFGYSLYIMRKPRA